MIALNEVADEGLVARAIILLVVAVLITALVYGVVGLIVKMDDAGLALAKRPGKAVAGFGRGLVKAMPIVLSTLSWVGMVAMLWVGGHILLVGADELGLHAPVRPGAPHRGGRPRRHRRLRCRARLAHQHVLLGRAGVIVGRRGGRRDPPAADPPQGCRACRASRRSPSTSRWARGTLSVRSGHHSSPGWPAARWNLLGRPECGPPRRPRRCRSSGPPSSPFSAGTAGGRPAVPASGFRLVHAGRSGQRLVVLDDVGGEHPAGLRTDVRDQLDKRPAGPC